MFPILGTEFFWGMAAAIAYMPTVVTGYIKFLGYSSFIVGMMPAFFWGGYSLSQAFSLKVIKPGPKNFGKVIVLFVAAGCSLTTLGVLLSSFEFGNATRLMMLFGAYSLFVFLVGNIDPHYIRYTYGAVKDAFRGRFFGLRSLSLGAGGLLGALSLNLFFGDTDSADKFHRIFIITGLLYVLSALSFSRYRHKETPNPLLEVIPKVRSIRQLLSDALSNRALATMLAGLALFFAAVSGGFSLYSDYIQRALDDHNIIASLTLASWIGNCFCSVIAGKLSDRFGYRAIFVAVCLVFSLGTLMLVWPINAGWCMAGYLLCAMWLPGYFVAGFNLVQSYAKGWNPTETMILQSMALLPVRLFSPLLVGWGMDAGFERWTVSLCAALTVASAVVVFLADGYKKDEP
ncbi:MAG: MFS transporter [Planctomycetota bacterium]|nr:MFS transporter [Planctomycetota bacterium]